MQWDSQLTHMLMENVGGLKLRVRARAGAPTIAPMRRFGPGRNSKPQQAPSAPAATARPPRPRSQLQGSSAQIASTTRLVSSIRRAPVMRAPVPDPPVTRARATHRRTPSCARSASSCQSAPSRSSRSRTTRTRGRGPSRSSQPSSRRTPSRRASPTSVGSRRRLAFACRGSSSWRACRSSRSSPSCNAPDRARPEHRPARTHSVHPPTALEQRPSFRRRLRTGFVPPHLQTAFAKRAHPIAPCTTPARTYLPSMLATCAQHRRNGRAPHDPHVAP
eukprot:6921580-Prymnesium_polylepis.1